MEDEWNELWSFKDAEAVQSAATQTLHNCGIKVPRRETGHSKRGSHGSSGTASFFGVPLESGQQPSVSYKYGEHGVFKLPRFLAEATQFLEQHSSRQGIFRKAGSVARQKALKVTLDAGNASIPEDANVHDIATLFKQYFRELPEPLITSRLFPVFEACYSLSQPAERQRCILLSCLLLPRLHLQCLCVLIKLLHGVAELATESLMDSSNLAIVIAPNIMRPHIDIISAAQGNPLKIKNQTGIAQLLIDSAPWIGCVPSSVYAVKKPVKANIDLFPTQPVVVDGEVKGQNSVHTTKVQNSMDSTRKVQRSTESAAPVQKPSETEAKVQRFAERETRVQRSSENGPIIQKSSENTKPPQQKVKVHTSLENHKVPTALPIKNTTVQNSLEGVTKGERSHVGGAEEVESAASKVIKEVGQASSVKEIEQVTPTPWTGSLLYVSLIGLLVLVVALVLSNILSV